ncbi:MAG: carboxylesterase family protein [Holophagales bacterium]|nr:carboxylesterase family protein [Holophagales bacterium]
MTERLSRACRWGGLAAILLFAFRVAGEERLVLPGVVRAGGFGGSRFVSTAWLHNPSDSQLAVDLALVASTGPAGTARLVLDPRQTLRVDDPVASLFGLDSAAGTLTARADRPFLLRGVTANVADPLGTYGLGLTALREAEALKAGETGIVPWLTHTLAAGTGFRTNVAVTLLEPGTEALVTIVDDTGLVRGEKRLSAADAHFWQQPVTELASDAEIPLGRVEVRVLRGSALAYAAVVDNVTGDGLLALARRVETPAVPPYALLLSGAARISGANGTLWRTGMRIVNPGLDPVEVTLESPGGSARTSRLVPPRGTLEESDLLGALGYPEGSAAPVRVTAPVRLSVLAATRNIDPSGRPGTFAASQEPTPQDALAGPGRVLAFTGLSADSGSSGFRTNVAFAGGPAGARGRLLLRASSGERLAEAGLEAGPSSWSQRSLGEWLGIATVPRDASLEVAVDSGSLDAYASVIDNGTGDPVILPPGSLPSAQCPPAGPAPFLSASSFRVEAGTSVALRLEAPGRATGRVVPGDLPLGPGESLFVVPAVTTTYRWIPSSPCSGDRSAPITVEVAAGAGAVLTEGGAVSGIASGGSTSYRGIPYAAPPAGSRRWRPPAPPAPWSGVRRASAFGAICAQLDEAGNVSGSEDCLFLNVWTPATPPASPLPVLFFIPGGGNAAGAGSYDYYDGTTFAEKGRAVVVTINYRLSSFGWLAQAFLSAETRRGVSGNYGTYDQLAALRWVKRNIAAFGGDPARVTIFGESAGGVNVCTLFASPLGKGLFERALVQSGGCTQRPLSEFVAFGNTLTGMAGCASDVDPAACLRAVPFDALLRALPPVVTVASTSGQLWGPAVDGFVLRDSPEVVIGKGEHNKVPFVIGANADETGSAAPLISSETEYRAVVAAQFGGLAPLVLARYPASAYATPRKAYVAVTTDARFVCPSRRFARAAAKGGSPVFRYFFSYPANRLFGAVHGIEIPFVFGTFDAIPGYTPGAAERALSESMNAAWAHFAATGDPSVPGGAAWPAYDPVSDRTFVWDAPSASVDGIRSEACDFWDSLVAGL